ncbi:Two-component sensor PilS [hydrothermal vent metagenome]|uniref:Two-component sensor PilS n=1 Tax=hydrothermal vent metagenome TaxID=652676 RepID=A0A3B1B512_9ZZZZ
MPASRIINNPAEGLKHPRDLLRLFFSYHLFLAFIFGILFHFDLPPEILGSQDPKLYAIVSLAYLVLVLTSGMLIALKTLSYERQTDFAVFVDIAAITLLMHASGGVNTGLGMLLLVSIAAGSLTIRRHAALLFAATASLAILAEQVFSHLYHSFPTTAYTQAGLLGASFFAMAWLADVLSSRLLETEKLASQQELDLANLAQLNEYIIQHMQTGIIIADENGQIRLENEAALNLLGQPETEEQASLDQAYPALSSQLEQWTRNPEYEPQIFRSSEAGRDLQANFIPLGSDEQIGTLIFLKDYALVTEQLQQMKLASLGRLSASIAHEIRNPLGAISHAGQLLEESPQIGSGDKRLTEIIRNNSQRVNAIIENVLQLSRRDRTQFQKIELKPWLKNLATEFRQNKNLDPGNLTVQTTPKNTLILADPSQLRQVLICLLENAINHFHQDKCKLLLQINSGIFPESGGGYIDVIDNGPGIKSGIARQIFEPFFTTHTTGTGLGLYIAKELSESNRVRLEYTPVPTGGSCFHISFSGLRKKVFNE